MNPPQSSSFSHWECKDWGFTDCKVLKKKLVIFGYINKLDLRLPGDSIAWCRHPGLCHRTGGSLDIPTPDETSITLLRVQCRHNSATSYTLLIPLASYTLCIWPILTIYELWAATVQCSSSETSTLINGSGRNIPYNTHKHRGAVMCKLAL